MEWLTQNWTYLLLLVGVILFMRFGGMNCGSVAGALIQRTDPPIQEVQTRPSNPHRPPIRSAGVRSIRNRQCQRSTRAAPITSNHARIAIVSNPLHRPMPSPRPVSKPSQGIATMAVDAVEAMPATSRTVELHAGGFAGLLGTAVFSGYKGLHVDAGYHIQGTAFH